MELFKVFLFVVLAILVELVSCSEESSKISQNSTETKRRLGRTDYEVYSPPDEYADKKSPLVYFPSEPIYKDDGNTNFRPSKGPEEKPDSQKAPLPSRDDVPLGFYKPKPRYYSPKDNMYKSGTNMNWNVWKGDEEVKPPPMPEMKGPQPPPPDFEEYFLPSDPWKDDPWTPDKMATMIMMMKEMQKPKPSGILSSFKKDPSTILLAAAIPVSLILAAVLPTLMNMMMNGGLPTVTTTATGTKARSLVDQEYLSPVVSALTTFGSRALENPECMQRIFCQITKGSANNSTDSRPVQKMLHKVSTFVDEDYLQSLGVKNLVDSMADGNCEKIPCTNFNSSDSSKHKRKGKISRH
ncbi:hypothetical protein AVEN_138921-1 [Araneus ventricosus]|uniref:Uncharacterized protein n=1 Tax=Araneus ventricosus TaxID=182803 RepID=A0A4Y2QG79_ARAVE|nr:hypothetical protein AVEN_138921-1 [Araneus ventricosus]